MKLGKSKGKLDGRSKKMNNRERSFLYLIAFSLTINQNLLSDFEDFLIKTLSLLSFSLLILCNLFLFNLHITSISTFFLFEDLLIEQLLNIQLRSS